MKPEYEIGELVPHSGHMSLLDRVVDYGEDWMRTEVRVGSESMFADRRGVPSWVGLEYMAQTIAAYAGLQERRQGGAPRVGFLLGSRNYSCDVEYFAVGQNLSIKVTRELIADNGLNVFACELDGEDLHAEAIVNVFQPDDVEQFLKETMA